MKIAVVGPGGVGGFLAAMLSRAGHEVILVARQETARIITTSGLTLESRTFGRFTMRPRVVTTLDEPVQLLFITVKAYDLEAAIDTISQRSVGAAVIIPLLNGFEHIPVLRERLGARIAPGMISIVAMKKNTATILHTSPHASIEIASREVPHNTLTLVADILTTAGIATRVLESEAEVIWRKFSRLAPLAAVTAALQKDLGHVREEDAAFLGELVRESAEAAEVAGAPITKESIISDIESLPAEVTTSLQRDVAAGHPTECDAIIGAIVRLLEQHHISHDAFDRANQLIQGGLS